MNYFIKFNNISSEGLFKIRKLPSRVFATKKIESYNIPTLDGDYYKDYGTYEAFTLELECLMKGNFNINNIQKVKEMFLDPNGKLEFSDEEGVYYKARLNNIISFDEISLISGEFLLNFIVFPKAYIIEGQSEIVVSNNNILTNLGNTIAEPTIKLEGITNNITITVTNNNISQSMRFVGVDDTIIVDCSLENCYGLNNQNYNNKLSLDSDFIRLGTGENKIILEPTGATIKIIPNWVRL